MNRKTANAAALCFQLMPTRVGLWDRYGGSQKSGHIHWLFEQQFPIPYQLSMHLS